jgi:hypothetical protein
MATVLRSAVSPATDVGFKAGLETAVGERYRVEVPDDGGEVRLRRLTWEEARPVGTSFPDGAFALPVGLGRHGVTVNSSTMPRTA